MIHFYTLTDDMKDSKRRCEVDGCESTAEAYYEDRNKEIHYVCEYCATC